MSAHRRHGRRLAVAATGTLLLGAGTAWALWSVGGSGSGVATAARPVSLVVTPTVAGDQLWPGGRGDVGVRVGNPNAFPVDLTSARVGSVVPADPSACPTTVVFVAAPAVSLAQSVPAGGDATVVLDDVVRLDPSAPDGCQGMSFQVAVTMTGTQGS